MDHNESESPEEIERLKQAIEALRERLKESAEKSKQLSWDTELLIQKTESVSQANKVSCSEPNWRRKVQSLDLAGGVWIVDVRTVDDIGFIAEFAALRQLVMTYGNRSFHLEPRPM